ncbi:MAG: DUF924 family protein [Hyphomicrobiales bacterium]
MTKYPTAKEVISFWFEEISPRQQFVKDPKFDDEIKHRFGPLHARLTVDVSDFTSTSLGALAAILVFDQFSRNMFRGSAQAFETDPLALSIAKELIATGADKTMPTNYRVFVYMPFMHAETLEDQEQSVVLFNQLGVASNINYAIKHHDVVKKYGRFPHRNGTLDRLSTEAEVAFINTPGTAF